MKVYNHLGIPTKEKKQGEIHIPHLKIYATDHEKSPNGIQWMRFEDDAPYPEIVRTLPHVAFEVEDLNKALEGQKVLIEPNSPSKGLVVAFIEDNGEKWRNNQKRNLWENARPLPKMDSRHGT